MVRYLSLLGLPYLLLGAFAATGAIPFAAVFLAGIGSYLLYAIADRVFYRRYRQVSYLELSWFSYLFVILIAIAVASMRYREYDAATALRVLASITITSGIMLFIPSAISSRRALHICIAAFDIVGLVISSTVFLAMAGVYEGEANQSVSGAVRIFGLFGDGVAFAVSLFVCRSWIAKKWAFFGFHLVALLLTAGVGGSLTLAVALIGHTFLPWRRATQDVQKESNKIISTVIACSLALIIVAIFGSQLVMRLSGPTLVSFTIASRFATYQVASEIIVSSPIIGIGPSGFSGAAARLAPESLFETFSSVYIATTQNQILQALCDSGIIGLGALLGFLIVLLRSLSKSAAAEGEIGKAFRGYQMWLLGLMVGNQSASWFLPFLIIPVLVFTIAGLSMAEAWLRDRECKSMKVVTSNAARMGKSPAN